jgi:AraC-like DNA-binding protein
MMQFVLRHECRELAFFPHVAELALMKYNAVRFNSFKVQASPTLRLYYVIEGKFEWTIDHQPHTLYPGDLAVVLPGVSFGGGTDFFDIGTLAWISIRLDEFDKNGDMFFGKWSRLSEKEMMWIGKCLLTANTRVLINLRQGGKLIETICAEISRKEMGYITRVNQLIDEIFILLGRRSTRQNQSHEEFPQSFLKLETSLRENLNHHWSVAEMASLVGLGHTAFSEKVKSYTGFSPLNYLINIRISKAVNLLKCRDCNVTDIALDTGFYSSQHFATTFKKLTGYSPREFRKKNGE